MLWVKDNKEVLTTNISLHYAVEKIQTKRFSSFT